VKEIKELIRRAIDLHVHIGPEPIPRKYTADTLVKEEKGKIKAICVKSHFFPTAPLISDRIFLIGSVTLNNYVGGLNPDIVLANAVFGKQIVWFPTINAKNFMKRREYEIPAEWVSDSKYLRKTSDIKGISVLKNKKLTKDALRDIDAIEKTNSVLATGHVSWKEAEMLAKEGLRRNIKVILTHPLYGPISMPLSVQRSLAKKGAFIEVTYASFTIDKIPVKRLAEQIRLVGPKNCIISSDVGQTFSKSPSKSLFEFANLLIAEGITKKELELMLVKSPTKIINYINKHRRGIYYETYDCKRS